MIRTTTIILALLGTLAPPACGQQSGALEWTDDLGTALHTARTANKPLMVLVYDSI